MRCAACVTQEPLKTFDDEDRLWAHIAVEHVFWIPFECLLCPLTMLPTETVLKQHYDQIHPTKVPKALYTYEEEKKKQLKYILALSLAIPTETLLEMPAKQTCELQTECIASPPPPTLPNIVAKITLEAEETVRKTAEALDSDVAHHPKNGDDPPVRSPIFHEVKDEVQCEKDVNIATDQMDNTPSVKRQQKSICDEVKSIKPSAFTTVECQLCGETLPSGHPEICKRHIWRQHMPRAPIQCRLCGWKKYVTDNAIRDQQNHIRLAHPEAKGKPLIRTFTDYRQKLAEIFANKLEAAFHSATVADSSKLNGTSVNNHQRTTRQAGNQLNQLRCKLCQDRRIGANRWSQHVWQHHMIEKRYACLTCQFATCCVEGIQSHSRKQHSESARRWTDNMATMDRDYTLITEKAFGGGGSKIDNTVYLKTCQLCHKTVQNRTLHIWVNHLSENRYRCTLCSYGTAILANITAHRACRHKGSKVCWIDHRQGMLSQYEMTYREAFGSYKLQVQKTQKYHKVTAAQNMNAVPPKSATRTPNSLRVKRSMPYCNTCKKETHNKGDHVWQKHMAKKRYACTLCDYKTAFGKAVKDHVKTLHDCVDFERYYVNDRKMELSDEYAHALQLAFGSPKRP